MGKFNKIIFIIAVITLLFHLAGIIAESPARVLLTLLLNYEGIATTSFIVKVTTVTASLVAAGVAIGAIIAGKPELAVKVPMFLFFVEIIYSWVSIINELVKFNKSVALLVGAPLLLLFVMIAFDWLFGRD